MKKRQEMESPKIKSSEITDERLYITRRHVVQAVVLAGSVAATGLLYRQFFPAATRRAPITPFLRNLMPADPQVSGTGFFTNEPKTAYDRITNYNNFYEFSVGKEEVADVAAK